jgi:hypothetical protein
VDCEAFKRRFATEPTRLDAAGRAHEVTCPSCAAYAARLRRTEALLHEALRIDVPQLGAARGSASPAARRPGRRAVAAAAMVVVIAAAAVFGGALPHSREAGLANASVRHWYHEPHSWERNGVRVPEPMLQAALGGSAAIDVDAAGTVSYARLCFVDWHWIPHLVVQGDRGPVMVLLFPAAAIEETVPLMLPQERLAGRLVPHDGGAVAILGASDEPLEDFERRMLSAIDWTS